MSKYTAHVPDFEVSGVADATEAKAAAEKKIANHKAGLTVAKVVVPDPIPDPPTTPPFLQGKQLLWEDKCSSGTPVEDGRWSLYPMGRQDGQQMSSTHISDIKPGRFTRIPNGGPHGEPYYQFYAPQGDGIWTGGSAGRSELSYPRGGSQSGSPGPNPNVVYFYEGQHRIILVSTRLPAPWDVSRPSWRVIHQLKQSEWEDQSGISPALAMEERSNNFIITNFGGPIIWSTAATAGSWLNFALAVDFSSDPNKGGVTVWLDKDLDGHYEYASTPWKGKTLNGVPSTIHTGCYEGVGGDTAHHTNYAIYG